MYRVQKLLSRYGFCSRRKAEKLIKQGRVRVNNRVVSIGDKADEDDTIYVDGKPVKKQRMVYIMFNKPLKCVTALKDKRHPTIFKFIKIKERIFPVGRLDVNTTGLLLLTNDGDFANKVMHPRNEVKKTYIAETNKPIKKTDIEKLREGITIDSRKVNTIVRVLKRNVLELTIHEGRKRIVRRMLKKLGYKVIKLKRVRIGNLDLGSLKTGRYRYLKRHELQKIFT